MPKETTRRVNQGAGSSAPKFTPPSVSVTTPSFVQREQPSDFQKFRDAAVSFGKGAASIASARSNIAVRMKALKKQGVAEAERVLARQAQHLQEQRAAEAQQDRRAILLEAEKKGPDWVERQFRSRMVNAGSAEEALFWEQSWKPAAAAVTRDNAEDFRQEFNGAVRSVDQISSTLSSLIESDAATKSTLTGDGENIATRVQDWMMLKVNEAQPGVFDLAEGSTEDQARSRDMLIHQLMQQSFRISDKLIREHNKNVEASNGILGTQQLESDFFSTLTGQQDPEFLHFQVEATMRDRYGHLTVEQQRETVRGMLKTSLQSLGTGAYGIDALDKLGAATALLTLEVDGEPVFSPAERQRATVDLLVAAENTAGREMGAALSAVEEGMWEDHLLPDGRTVKRPNPNADALMTTPDPLTGLTPIDDAANRVLAEMGLLDADDLPPEQERIRRAVRTAARAATRARQGTRVQAAIAVANHDTVLTGEPGGDANKAHRMTSFSRSHMSPQALTATKTPPMGARQIESFKINLTLVAETIGVDPAVVADWDGSNVEYTDENADLNRVMAVAEARLWSGGEQMDPRTGELVDFDVQSQYGIPSDLAKDKLALLRSNNPNRLMAFGQFVEKLKAGANEAWDNFLSAEGVTSQEKAAATWVRINLRQGRPRVSATGDVVAGDFPVDPAVLMTETQAILRSRPVLGYMNADTGLEGVDRSNAANMADIMAEIVSDQVKLEGDDRDRFGNKIQAQFQALFLSNTDHTGRMLRNLWFAMRAAEPDMDDGQRGAMLWAWLQGDGYRWREVNDRQILIIDPQGYTGEQGSSIQENIDANMTRQFSPLYRAFLQKALNLEGSQVPNNTSQLFMVGTGEAPPSALMGTSAVRGVWNMSDQITDRLLESRANYGGFFIEGRDSDGVPLPVPVAKQDTLMRWPDGSTFMVKAGVILSITGNNDIYATPRRVPRARRRSFAPVQLDFGLEPQQRRPAQPTRTP